MVKRKKKKIIIKRKKWGEYIVRVSLLVVEWDGREINNIYDA